MTLGANPTGVSDRKAKVDMNQDTVLRVENMEWLNHE